VTDALLVDEATRAPVISKSQASEQTIIRIRYDLFHEVRYLLTKFQPETYASAPTLDLHIALLRDLITGCSIPIVEIPPVPAGYNFIACLTHDVDHPGIRNHKLDHTMFGFLYRASVASLLDALRGRKTIRQLALNWAAAATLPFVYLGLAKDFWRQFQGYCEFEKGSTFFVIPRKGDPGQGIKGERVSRRAAKYAAAELKPELERLRSEGKEIGLHGINAWLDIQNGQAELAQIGSVTGNSNCGVRMHWLAFNERSPAVLEAAGFDYDSTIGYNRTIGYRAGTAQAFKPLGLKRLLELPLHIMDTAMFYPVYMNLSPQAAKAATEHLLNNAVRFGGAVTINWHDRSLAPERLWDSAYTELVGSLKQKRAWFPTANQAVDWFKKRRAVRLEPGTMEGKTLRISTGSNRVNDGLPGLKVRVHKPSKRIAFAPAVNSAVNEFVDLPFDQAEEVCIAL